ncbi:MAG: cytidylate kinase-like family protein [bacterium]|nr:cytidylate kinase-like family protein [bacterium]
MIVAIARQFGAGTNRVAAAAAAGLGYELVADQLPETVAIRLDTSPEDIRGSEQAVLSFGERLLRSLQAATPEVGAALESADDDVVREIQRLVREYAERGNCVIVGHGATAILRGRPDVVSVLVGAPIEWRAQRIADWWKVSPEVARAEIERVDRARLAYVTRHYGADASEPGRYALTVDTQALGFEAAAAAIVAAVQAKSPA